VRQQPTTTPTVLVYTVNGRPLRDYLHDAQPAPVRLLVADVDGHRVVWSPRPPLASCARHRHLGGCPCVQQLGRLATPQALGGWYRGLSWRQRQQLSTAPAAVAAAGGLGREWPDWTWGLGHRLLLAAALLAVVLLLAPLLPGR
jgi:hypothetical protein